MDSRATVATEKMRWLYDALDEGACGRVLSLREPVDPCSRSPTGRTATSPPPHIATSDQTSADRKRFRLYGLFIGGAAIRNTNPQLCPSKVERGYHEKFTIQCNLLNV